MSPRRYATAVAVTAACLAAPAGAVAATNPYTPQQVCGRSYTTAQSAYLWSLDQKVVLGRSYLMYSLQTGKSCAVTLKLRKVGTPTYTSATVGRKAKHVRWRDDSGYYRYYAGPMYAAATPACVRYGGYMKIPHGREGLWVEPDWNGC